MANLGSEWNLSKPKGKVLMTKRWRTCQVDRVPISSPWTVSLKRKKKNNNNQPQNISRKISYQCTNLLDKFQEMETWSTLLVRQKSWKNSHTLTDLSFCFWFVPLQMKDARFWLEQHLNGVLDETTVTRRDLHNYQQVIPRETWPTAGYCLNFSTIIEVNFFLSTSERKRKH